MAVRIPLDLDLYESAEGKHGQQLPGLLEATLKGEVFTPDLLETWIELNRRKEVAPVRLWPYLFEFALYYDV